MSINAWLNIFVILMGAVCGSFATVLTDRIPKAISIVKPRSRCPLCHTQLLIRENIPLLGYFLNGGKCRTCGEKISLKYPIIEFVTVFLFILSFLIYKNSIATIALFVLATVTMPLVLIDAEFRRLPNVLTGSAFIGGVSLATFESIRIRSWEPLQHSLLYLSLSFAFFLILNVASRGGMGFGDIKLATMIGGLLFFMPWKNYVAIYFVAFGLGSLYGISLMILKQANRKSMIPFGPFILFGAWAITAAALFQ